MYIQVSCSPSSLHECGFMPVPQTVPQITFFYGMYRPSVTIHDIWINLYACSWVYNIHWLVVWLPFGLFSHILIYWVAIIIPIDELIIRSEGWPNHQPGSHLPYEQITSDKMAGESSSDQTEIPWVIGQIAHWNLACTWWSTMSVGWWLGLSSSENGGNLWRSSDGFHDD